MNPENDWLRLDETARDLLNEGLTSHNNELLETLGKLLEKNIA